MIIDKKNPQAVGPVLGTSFSKINNKHSIQNNRFSQSGKKIRPGYYSELEQCPNCDPIIVSLDWLGVNLIRKYSGICLLCDKDVDFYELSWCAQKETWVIYSQPHDFERGKNLAYKLLIHGACKVLIILIGGQVAGGGCE